MARLGFSPPQVDALEVWEVAASLGVGLYKKDDEDDAPREIVPYSKGGRDPNLTRRIRRGLGYDDPDIEVASYHPRMGRLN